MNHEKGKCRCAVCELVEAGMTREEAEEKRRQWEMEKMAEYGWIAHFVGDDSDSPTGYNVHTHGLVESFDHPDLQIVCPMPEQLAHKLLCNLVSQITEEGKKFKAGDVVERVLGQGYKTKLVDAQECGRPVLRLIMPDEKGNLDVDKLEESYRIQYADLGPLPPSSWVAHKMND